MAADPLAPLLADPASTGLFFDVDGVLAPIAPHPDLAAVPPGRLEALRRLVDRYGVVACVSGRSLASLRRTVPVPGLALAGNHGLELDDGRGGPTIAAAAKPFLAPAAALAADLRGIAEAAGGWVEEKGPTLTVHWREAPDPDEAGPALTEHARRAGAARGFDARPARMAVELRPPLPLDKGTAVRALLERRSCDHSLYAGDDTTDIDAFRVVEVAVAVVSDEAPPGLVESATLVVQQIDEVLERLLRAAGP